MRCDDAKPAKPAPVDAVTPETGPSPDPKAPKAGEEGVEGADGEKKPESKPLGAKCKKELLRTFGMEGNLYGEEMTLDMCGDVTNSCCQIKDQLQIYENWETAQIGKKLKERLADQFKIYSELLAEMEKAGPIAAKVFAATKSKKVSNCKLVSQRVMEFNLTMIGPKVKEALRAMHAFFYDTYKGVLCSVCNAVNQEFFLIEKKQVIMSEQFCRNILSNSLHSLLYFHVHLKRLSNLVGIMLTSCDLKGKFESAITVPISLNFVVDEVDQRQLYDCRNFRDDPEWLAYCAKICEEFHLTRYSEFFQPDLDKYKKVTKFFKSKLKRFEEKEKKTKGAVEKSTKKKGNDKKDATAKDSTKKAKKSKKLRMLSSIQIHRDVRMLAEEKKEEKAEKKAEKEEEKKEEKKEEKEEKKEEETKISVDETEEVVVDVKLTSHDQDVIRETINGEAPLGVFKVKIKELGIDLYTAGKAAKVNKATYDTVLNLVTLMNEKEPTARIESGKGLAVYVTLITLVLFAFRNEN